MPIITAIEQPKSTTITRTTGTTAFASASKASQAPTVPNASPVPANAPQSDAEQQAATTPKGPSQDERMALLARKERALQAQIKELKALQAQAKPQEASDKLTKPIFDKASFLKNPEAHGVSREELEQVLLGQMAQSPEADLIRRLQSKVEELESKTTNTVKSIEEQQTKAYQQAVKQIETEVNTLVDTSDAFVVIKADGRQSAVVKLIERTYKEDGILLDAETAAAQVEEELLARALKLASVSKVKAKLLPSVPAQSAPLESAQQTTAQAASQQTPTPTLSTAMAQQTAKRSYSAAERLARAKLIAQGKNPDAA